MLLVKTVKCVENGRRLKLGVGKLYLNRVLALFVCCCWLGLCLCCVVLAGHGWEREFKIIYVVFENISYMTVLFFFLAFQVFSLQQQVDLFVLLGSGNTSLPS